MCGTVFWDLARDPCVRRPRPVIGLGCKDPVSYQGLNRPFQRSAAALAGSISARRSSMRGGVFPDTDPAKR